MKSPIKEASPEGVGKGAKVPTQPLMVNPLGEQMNSGKTVTYTLFPGWDFHKGSPLDSSPNWVLVYEGTGLVRWKSDPQKDPTSEDPSSPPYIEKDGQWEKFEAWLVGAEEFLQALKLPVELAVKFHQLCVEAGFTYTDSGYLEYWVYERMADIISHSKNDVCSDIKDNTPTTS